MCKVVSVLGRQPMFRHWVRATAGQLGQSSPVWRGASVPVVGGSQERTPLTDLRPSWLHEDASSTTLEQVKEEDAQCTMVSESGIPDYIPG